MQVFVTINLNTPHDQWGMTSKEAAEAVLAALGGDPEVDTCTVQANIPPAFAGVDPSAPMPVPPDPLP